MPKGWKAGYTIPNIIADSGNRSNSNGFHPFCHIPHPVPFSSSPPLSSSSIWLSGTSDGVSLRVLLFVMKIRFRQINGEILEKKHNLKESIHRKKEWLWLWFLKHGGGLTDLNVLLSVFVCVCVYTWVYDPALVWYLWYVLACILILFEFLCVFDVWLMWEENGESRYFLQKKGTPCRYR